MSNLHCLHPEITSPKPEDETLRRLIDITNQTALIAIDKSMAAIRRAPKGGYAVSAARCGDVGKKLIHAMKAVGLTLPKELR